MKRNFTIILIFLSLFFFLVGFFCDKDFFGQYFSEDGQIIEPLYISFISLFRMVCVIIGSIILVMTIFLKQIKKYKFVMMEDWKNSMFNLRQLMSKKLSLAEIFPQPPRTVKIVSMGILLVLNFFIVYAFNYNRPLLDKLTTENGIFETLTVIFYLFAATLAVKHIWGIKHKRVNTGMRKWWLILAALFFVFVAMEEINWGQTYLKFSVPSTLSDINFQNQTSLHSIKIPYFDGEIKTLKYWDRDLLRLIAFCMGIILPLLLCLIPRLSRFFLALQIPLPSYVVLYGFISAALIPSDKAVLGLFVQKNAPSEIREFTCALGFLFLIWHSSYAHKKIDKVKKIKVSP